MKNTITQFRIDHAFARMIVEKLPIEEFNPNEKTGEFDFVFSRELGYSEQKKAEKIIKEEIGNNFKIQYIRGEG